ncbi:hypothetical protein [[Clostridium] fimetarium]|uniref:Uncharacterized protein n=1 Tax=[Clostridium] fimetarium TaxID=99656 RepID=A0A1I0QNV1_9FIRM|nr:hypothetical protein [[Clostridium] fimetarium]SEW28854.1 hypothetical protein SAMN05421659_108184 [[Clostridium] fimetarium]
MSFFCALEGGKAERRKGGKNKGGKPKAEKSKAETWGEWDSRVRNLM